MDRRKNIFIKRFICVFIVCGLLSMSWIELGKTVSAKPKPTSGVDDNGNRWAYNKENKTLTFSGKKDIGINYGLDGHSSYPAWFAWQDEVKVLNIEDGITGLTEGTFYEFNELESVMLPDSVTHIEDETFDGCRNLKRIKMSKNTFKIGEYAFEDCSNLKSIVIPDKMKRIASCTFMSCCKLKSILLHNSVKKLGSYSFSGCKNLKKVKLAENLQEISEGLFMDCKSLKSIIIPKSVKRIEGGAFIGTGIENITIPVNVTSFVKSEYGDGILERCKKLKKVIIKSGKLTRVDKTVFNGFNKKAVIEVPKSKLEEYSKMFHESGLSTEVKIEAFD